MEQIIEILSSDEHWNAQKRFLSFKPLTYPLAIAEQKKSSAVDVSAYGRMRVTLELVEVPSPLRVALHVTIEGAPEQNGPWGVLHALSPLQKPGNVVADVELGSAKWVRASWFWQGPIGLEFGISALAFEGTRAEPAATEPDPLRELPDREIERMAAEAAVRLAELDAAATKLAEEHRNLSQKFKTAPTPKLASECAAARQLAQNARDEHRAYFEETYPLARELARRASVKRLAVLRAEAATLIDYKAAGDRLAATFITFLSQVGSQLGELRAVLAARTELLGELNELESQVGDRTQHRPTDEASLHRLIAQRAGEHLKHVYPRRPPSAIVWEIQEWMGLSQPAPVAEPALTTTTVAEA
jgi:hypothetical protein